MLARISSRRFVGNYFSTLAFIALSYWIVTTLSPFHQGILQAQFDTGSATLTVHTLFLWLIAAYLAVLIPFYAAYPWLRSKAFIFLHGLWFAALRLRHGTSLARRAAQARQNWRLPWRVSLSPASRQASLALLLKFFFAPLMINWCLSHAADMASAIAQVISSVRLGLHGRALFDAALYWAAFQAILFVDTLLFTLGYIIEVPGLKNRIRSVDPTFFGWFICLACYPPFNDFTSRFLEWQSSDAPRFANDGVHYVACGALLLAMAIYSWASIELGFKASNLTNRGIVTGGPYSRVRHPAYAAKNLAWWIGALPTLYVAFTHGTARDAAYAVMALLGWTAIYALRALTEERHLLMADNGYAEYMQKVQCRFIPGLI